MGHASLIQLIVILDKCYSPPHYPCLLKIIGETVPKAKSLHSYQPPQPVVARIVVECVGNGAAPPATLAEFIPDGDVDMDFYDVSLVDGYNVSMLVVPQGGSGASCTTKGCVSGMNDACPSDLPDEELRWRRCSPCKSACLAFGKEQYCCSGMYSTPECLQAVVVFSVVQERMFTVHTAMPMMIKPEPSHVPAPIISLHFARRQIQR
ncbi:Pathogenesis-related thaumatin superfamily protein [Abeliophyllum distichum]|uniref:Pathogenesis-related thaumatin superfamily protein n=1 Tax=Abeliophyllum distichum TaxID=126358 RepID=A0ABD1VWL3_9LAMI